MQKKIDNEKTNGHHLCENHQSENWVFFKKIEN
jgi:hypothetical protein